jgi:hypothetical protein
MAIELHRPYLRAAHVALCGTHRPRLRPIGLAATARGQGMTNGKADA